MTIDQHIKLLNLYKKKVAGELYESMVSSLRLEAKIELDNSYVKDLPTNDIQEFINELNLL